MFADIEYTLAMQRRSIFWVGFDQNVFRIFFWVSQCSFRNLLSLDVVCPSNEGRMITPYETK